MGKSITQHGMFSKKAASSGGGGGGTGDMTQAVYDPAGISTQLLGKAISVARTDISTTTFLDSQLYRITDMGAATAGLFSTVYAMGLYDGSLSTNVYGKTAISGALNGVWCEMGFDATVSNVEVFYFKDPKRNILITSSNLSVYTTLTAWGAILNDNASVVDNIELHDQLSLNTQLATGNGYTFQNIRATNLTIDTNFGTVTGVSLINYEGSSDIITFTANNQFVNGLNYASGRTISFAATTGLSYTNCTIGGGKSLTIKSSQNEAVIIDTISTFKETFDCDTIAVGDKWIDLVGIEHAGIVEIDSSGGLNPLPNFQYVQNGGTDVLVRKFITKDYLTTTPAFSNGAGPTPPQEIINFGTFWIGFAPVLLDSPDKFVELTYSPTNSQYSVTNLFF